VRILGAWAFITPVLATGEPESSQAAAAARPRGELRRRMVDSPSTTGFRVRVLNQNGAVVGSQSVTLSYHAVAGATG
jgi:hypothetical protein